MKLKIGISLLNDKGSLAQIQNEDERLELCESYTSRDAKKLCLEAAKRLRECAVRFELLANEPDPFKATTHDRVNRVKLP